MTVWILILVAWIALISLIMHDATKDDADGSAVIRAARIIAAFLCSASKNLLAALRDLTNRCQEISSKLIRRDAPSAIVLAPTAPSKKTWWRKHQSMTATELEMAVAEAVKSEPGCEGFIGVVVQPKTPEPRLDSNWEVQGVRYGRAEREIADKHLARIVARLQREFRLTDPHHVAPFAHVKRTKKESNPT